MNPEKPGMLAEAKSEETNPTWTHPVRLKSQPAPTTATSVLNKHVEKIAEDESQPPLPTFGWENILEDNDPLPYVVRDSVSYVAWIIYEKKILSKFFKVLSKSVLSFVTPDLKEMTENEAFIYNEINLKHCDGSLVGKDYRFRAGQPMISFEDLKTSLTFFLTCYNMACLTEINNGFFGFIKISGENEVAFVWHNNTKLVPLFYFEGQSEYLETNSVDLIDKWKIRYMRFCCMAQGIRKDYYQQSALKVVDFEFVKKLFPENTSVEFCWPKDFDQDILAPEIRMAVLHGTVPNPLPLRTLGESPADLIDGINSNKLIHRPAQATNGNSIQFQHNMTPEQLSGKKRTALIPLEEPKKRLRCQKKPQKSTINQNTVKEIQHSQPGSDTTSSTISTSINGSQQPSILYSTADLTVSLLTNGQYTNEIATTAIQPTERTSVSMAFHAEANQALLRAPQHYGCRGDSQSTTSTVNQTLNTSTARVTNYKFAVQTGNRSNNSAQLSNFCGPLNLTVSPPRNMRHRRELYFGLFDGVSINEHSYQIEKTNVPYSSPKTAASPEYMFPTLGFNETASLNNTSNGLGPSPQTYSQHRALRISQRSQTVTAPNTSNFQPNYSGNQTQILNKSFPLPNEIYQRLYNYFQEYIRLGSHLSLNALTKTFMNGYGLSSDEQARLGLSIHKALSDMCHRIGYFSEITPVRGSSQQQTTAATNNVIKVIECEHVNNGRNYAVKELTIVSQKIYGISSSTVMEKFLVNCSDLEAKLQKLYKDYLQKISQMKVDTLYYLNSEQKLVWNVLVNAGLVCIGPYSDFFVEYSVVLEMLSRYKEVS